MSDKLDKLPRRCGDGEPDGFGCGLFFAAKDREAYEEHKPLCRTYTLPDTPPTITYGYGKPTYYAL